MTKGTGFPRKAVLFMISAAAMPMRMPSTYRPIITLSLIHISRIQGDKGVRLTCQDPQGQPLTAQEVYAKVNPSVVTVVSEQADGA